MHERLIRRAIAAAALTLAFGACNQHKATTPELQTTTGVQAKNEPMTVEGCLKSGMADDTFVLTASKTGGAFETATYQLTGPEGLNLRKYIGQRVEVSGTLLAQQQVTSVGETSEQKPAKGTTGTPTVETASQLEVKRLSVSSMKPTGNRCD